MEWHEWNGKNGMAEMEAGGLECLVYNSTLSTSLRGKNFQRYGYSHDCGTMFILYFLQNLTSCTSVRRAKAVSPENTVVFFLFLNFP